MKYIKTFEIAFNDIKISKYILIQKPRDTDTYFILEPYSIYDSKDSGLIQSKKLFTFKKSDNYLRKNKHQFFDINTKTELQYIVYQSDNIQELKDILPTLRDIDKYNL